MFRRLVLQSTARRSFSTATGSQGSSGALVGAAAVACAGAGYYYFQQNTVDYKAVKAAIADVLEDENHDDGSYGPVFVRLSWHNAGTFDKATGSGGSEGAGMRYVPEADWGANAGLAIARARLESVKSKFPGISYSDLWTLAGTTAIEEMGGPVLPFHCGRVDVLDKKLPDGLLPDADGRDKKDSNVADHLRDIFYRMGFNDREIVALSGAHALGRCHVDASGFWGPWSRSPTTFSNEYFKLLLDEKWTLKKTHKGKKWTGPPQFEDKAMKPFVEMYAKDENLFFEDFSKAWTKLMSNGCKSIKQASV